MSFVSYAQNYEDVMLARAFRGLAKGFYIDVGAQDPRFDSVTKAFYDMGWHGINLEPVEHWHAKLQQERPRDINLCLAAGDHAGLIEFHETDESGLSTGSAEFARRHREQGHALRTRQVPVATLDAICREQGVGEIHFLKVDVEGAEAEVLRGIDLSVLRPWVILVESTEPNSLVSTHEHWESLVTGRGYRLIYQDGLNRFYLAEEHGELAPAFAAPPNIFDDFIRREQFDLGELLGAQVRELNQHIAAVQQLSERRAEVVAELQTHLAERERQHQHLLEYQQAAEANQAALRQAVAAEQEAAVQLRQQAAQFQDQAGKQQEQAERLQQQVTRFEERHAADLQSLRELSDLQQVRLSRIAVLEAEQAQLQSLSEERAAALQRSQSALARSEAELARTSRELLDAVSGRLTASARLEASLAAHARSLQELAQAQRDFQILVGSRSWRITAPLRRFNAWVARVRARLAQAARSLARFGLARRLVALALLPFPGVAKRVKRRLYGEPVLEQPQEPEAPLLLTADAEAVLEQHPVQPRAATGTKQA